MAFKGLGRDQGCSRLLIWLSLGVVLGSYCLVWVLPFFIGDGKFNMAREDFGISLLRGLRDGNFFRPRFGLVGGLSTDMACYERIYRQGGGIWKEFRLAGWGRGFWAQDRGIFVIGLDSSIVFFLLYRYLYSKC